MRVISDDAWGITTIFQEAESEHYAGKLAVAEVILTRTRNKFRSDGSVAGTVLRDRQFSGWNAQAKNRTRSARLDDGDAIVQECIKAWAEAKTGTATVAGAEFYVNLSIVKPEWIKELRFVKKVGAHSFYARKV